MNNPMEYFRKGAEKRKTESLKGKSMYQDGDEFIGPKTESEANLEKLQMLNDMGLMGNQNIVGRGEPKPPPGKVFGRRHPRYGYEILEDPQAEARSKQLLHEHRRSAMANSKPKLMGRPPRHNPHEIFDSPERSPANPSDPHQYTPPENDMNYLPKVDQYGRPVKPKSVVRDAMIRKLRGQ